MADLALIGFRYSVYTRVIRMTLAEKSLHADDIEADPFSDPPDPRLLAVNPFNRVPVLIHRGFTIYETAAITAYLDTFAPLPSLVPRDRKAVARKWQTIGIVDSDAYRVLVRQVYSHLVFRPAFDLPGDPAVIRAGLTAAPGILAALEAIAAEGLQLTGAEISRADLHLAPMIATFAQAQQGRELLNEHLHLASWFARMEQRDSFLATQQDFPAV